jgi:hypothetical protein
MRFIKTMPPKMCTRTQLRVTDINEIDDTLQAAASTTDRATPTVLPEAEIADEDDNDLYNDLGGQRNKDIPINNDCGDLRSQITDEDHLDVATQNRLMLEMLLENQAQWKAEQKLERERMAAELERMAAERDQHALGDTITAMGWRHDGVHHRLDRVNGIWLHRDPRYRGPTDKDGNLLTVPEGYRLVRIGPAFL